MNLRTLLAILTVFIAVASIVESCNFGKGNHGGGGSGGHGGSGSHGSGGKSGEKKKKWNWKCGKYRYYGTRIKLADGSFSGEGDWYVDGKIKYSGFMSGSLKARKFKMTCGTYSVDGEGDETADGQISGPSCKIMLSGKLEFTGSFSSEEVEESTSNTKEYEFKSGKWTFKGKGTQNADGTFTGTGTLTDESGTVVYSGDCSGTYHESAGEFKVKCGEYDFNGSGGEGSGTATVMKGGQTVYTGTYTLTVTVSSSGGSSSGDTKKFEFKSGKWIFKGEGTQNADGTFTATGTLTDEAGTVVYSGECSGTYTESAGEFKVKCGEYDFNGSGGEASGTATVMKGGQTLYTGTYTLTVTVTSSGGSSSGDTKKFEFKSGSWIFKGEGTQNADGTFTATGTLTDEAGTVVYSGECSGTYTESAGEFKVKCGEYDFNGSGGEASGTATVMKGGQTLYTGTYTLTVTVTSSGGSSSGDTKKFEFKSGSWIFKGEGTQNADGTFTATGTLTDEAGTVVYSGECSGTYTESAGEFKVKCGEYDFNGSGGEASGTATVMKGGQTLYTGTYTLTVTVTSSGGSGSGGASTYEFKSGEWLFKGELTVNADGTYTGTGKLTDATGAEVYSGDVTGKYDVSTKDFQCTCGEYDFSGSGGEGTGTATVTKGGQVVYSGTFTVTVTGGSSSGGGEPFSLAIGDWTFEGTGTKNADGTFTANGMCKDASGTVVYEGDISGTMDETTGDLTATAGEYSFSYSGGTYTIMQSGTSVYTWQGTFTFSSSGSSSDGSSGGGEPFSLAIGDWTFEGTGTKNADGTFTANGMCKDASGTVVYEGDISGTMDETTGDLTATAGEYSFSYSGGTYTIMQSGTSVYTWQGTFTFSSSGSSSDGSSGGGEPFSLAIGDWTFEGTGTKNADGTFTANGMCKDASGTVVYEGDISGTMDETTGDLTATAGEYSFSYSGGTYTIMQSGTSVYTWQGTFTFSSSGSSSDGSSGGGEPFSLAIGDWTFEGTGTKNADGTFTANGMCKDASGTVVYEGDISGTMDETTGDLTATAGEYSFSYSGGTYTIMQSGTSVYTWQGTFTFSSSGGSTGGGSSTGGEPFSLAIGDWTFEGTGTKNADGTFTANGMCKDASGTVVYEGDISGTMDETTGDLTATAGEYSFSYSNGEYTIMQSGTSVYTWTGTFTFSSTGSSASSGSTGGGSSTGGDAFSVTFGTWSFEGTGTLNADGSFSATGDLKDASGTVVFSGSFTGTMDDATGALNGNCGTYVITISGGQISIMEGSTSAYTDTGSFACSCSSGSSSGGTSGSTSGSGTVTFTVDAYTFTGSGQLNADGTFTATGELKQTVQTIETVLYSGTLTGSVDLTTGVFQATSDTWSFDGTGQQNADGSISGTCSAKNMGQEVASGSFTIGVVQT